MKNKNSEEQKECISLKNILEFSCCVKIEKNGIEIKSNYLQSGLISSILLIEKIYKSNNEQPSKIMYLQIKHKSKEVIYSCQLKYIVKIIEKYSFEGKLSLFIINKSNERELIFLSKTTKEILDNFIDILNTYHPIVPQQNSQKVQPQSMKNVYNSNNQSTLATITDNKVNIKHKRKFNELYAKHHQKQFINDTKVHKSIPQGERLSMTKAKNKRITDMPFDLLYIIFDYINKNVLMTKFSLMNQEIKSYIDDYIDTLTIRDDTPNKIFNLLIKRFKNAQRLIFGKAKNFNNETIKNINIGLDNLEYLDISEITIINDSCLKKLFSKTKALNISTLKMNYFVDSLYTGLIYINDFFHNINELTLTSSLGKIDKEIERLSQFPKYYHSNLFQTIHNILKKEKSKIRKFSIFIFNTAVPFKFPKLFDNLTSLEIDILLIDKVKDLQILYHCSKMTHLNIKHIAIRDCNNKQNKYSYSLIDFNQLNDCTIPLDEQLDILSIDFDNDYTEVFGKIFYYLKNISSLTLGSFVTEDLCKLIAVYLKKLTKLSLSSLYITDVSINEIFKECVYLQEINLEGCNRFLGSCFENGIPPKLKTAYFSIMTYNFNRVINFLKSNGINAENTIKTNI